MNIEKVKSIFLYLTTRLSIFICYIMLYLAFMLICCLLNFKGIQIFACIAIITVAIFLGLNIRNIIKTLKNKKKPKVYMLILNICLLFGCSLMPFFLKDLYLDYDRELTLLEMFSQEDVDILSANFSEHTYKGVTVYHDNIDARKLKKIEKSIDTAISRIPTLYSNLKHKNVKLFLHDKLKAYGELTGLDLTKEDLENHLIPSGFFNPLDKTMNMPFFDNYDVIDKDFNGTFMHEFNHYLLDKLATENNIDRKKIPAWFDEGTSDFFADGDTHSGDIEYFVDYDELDSVSGWMFTNFRVYANSYPQSHYTICYLVQKTDIKVIERIILGMENSTFEKSFKKEVGQSLDSFLEETKKAFMNYFSVPEDYVIT